MTSLAALLTSHVEAGSLPGAVSLVARGDEVEVAAVGRTAFDGPPMERRSLFRVASLTKPITAAALLLLVADGRVGLHDPVDEWLPELAAPRVVRTPQSPLDDVVPAARPVTVFDLLTARAGYGFPSDFSLPAVQALFSDLRQRPPEPSDVTPDEWIADLARIPMLAQPGERWLYNTTSDIQGVLIARLAGRPLPEFLAERIFEPLRMVDTAFSVRPADLDRCTALYRPTESGPPELWDAPDGLWSREPGFPSGAGGLVSTVDDLHAFSRMLLADGAGVLTPDSVRLMTTDHLTPEQRAGGELFLEGQGWGCGGSVDVAVREPWNVPGRYGWIGGTGTSAHAVPTTGTVAILLTQLGLEGPTPPRVLRDFWAWTAT
ncbi:serine hydrolase domain-containing protein [Streptomyces sp. NPDC017979]|uniref:serine hydrolase domain-containing protein n=1 Tax=Streptomyces sp. NPDC017979 TaxID=3365024 RepID=UPI0037A4CFB9